MTKLGRGTPDLPEPEDGVYALSLIDQRTGKPLRTNGALLTIFTRQPNETATEALRGRDRSIWQVRIERLPAPGTAGA